MTFTKQHKHHRSWPLLTALALVFSGEPLVARSQELQIGHLEETQEDKRGINWLFFHCFQNGQSLDCDVFQTLISHKLSAADRDAQVEKDMQGDPVKSFTELFPAGCKKVDQLVTAMTVAARTGKAADGTPLDMHQAADGLKMANATAEACRNPNPDTVRRVYEATVDQEISTCTVLNDYSRMHFSWNAVTGNWVSQEGPNGICGRISIGTLERDTSSSSHFWKYTEKKINTNPNGEGPIGSCHQLPEYSRSVLERYASEVGRRGK